MILTIVKQTVFHVGQSSAKGKPSHLFKSRNLRHELLVGRSDLSAFDRIPALLR